MDIYKDSFDMCVNSRHLRPAAELEIPANPAPSACSLASVIYLVRSAASIDLRRLAPPTRRFPPTSCACSACAPSKNAASNGHTIKLGLRRDLYYSCLADVWLVHDHRDHEG